MICSLCSDNTEIKPDKKSQLREHLIVTLDKNNHFHIHGPIENQSLMAEFIKVIAKEAGIEINDEEDSGTEAS